MYERNWCIFVVVAYLIAKSAASAALYLNHHDTHHKCDLRHLRQSETMADLVNDVYSKTKRFQY